MSLHQQLNDILHNQSRSLDDRLEVAHKVFCSPTISIAHKEDIILRFISDSLNDLIEKKAKEEEFNKFLRCLSKCLENDRQGLDWELTHETTESIIKVLPRVNAESVFNCAKLILATPRFQRWLTCDVTLLCHFLGSLLQVANSQVECLIRILDEFLRIFKASSFKEEGQMCFIREVLFPLGGATNVLRNKEMTASAVNCVNSIVFYSRQVLTTFWELMRLKKPSKKSVNPLEILVARLKRLPKYANAGTVSSTFCLIIEASSMKLLSSKVSFGDGLEKRQREIFELFIILCQPLGITVNKKVSISLSPVENWSADASYAVVRDMIRSLDRIALPLNLEFDGFNLNSWLISLVIGMTSINLTELSPPLLEMTNAVYSFNPLVIEPSLKIIGHIMIRKKPFESSKAYVELMKTVFQGAASVQRLQKTLSLLLVSVQDSLSQHLDDNLTLEDILPEELGGMLSNLLESLPNAQLLSTFRAFLFHLERDCLHFIEAGCTDKKIVIITEFIGDLISRLIFSAKVADHSVPDEIKNKFNNIFEDWQAILGKMGSACQDHHDDRLLKAFLKMCYACGELYLMVQDYEGTPIKPLEKKDFRPLNLSYAHPYLSGEDWEKIGVGITGHKNCLAETELLSMMVQKARAVAQVEEGADGPGTMVARMILESASVTWLWAELVSLAPLFQVKELMCLVKKLVNDAGDDQSLWTPLIGRDDFLENRCLVLATVLSLMLRASKRMNKSFTHKNMSHIQAEILLEYEISQLITEDDDLADEIKSATQNMAKALEDKLTSASPTASSIPNKSFFQILHQLPVHHFSLPTQCCLLLSLTSLLWELPSNRDVDILILDVLSRIVSGPKKNARELLGGLNSGHLLTFLSHRAAGYSDRNRLLKSLCVVALSDIASCKQLIKQVYKLDRESLWLKTLVVFTLTQAKKKTVFKQTEDSEDEDGDDDSADDISEDKLVDRDNCIEIFMKEIKPVLDSECPSTELITAFYLFLRQCIKKNTVKSSENRGVLAKLPEYVDLELKTSTDSHLVEIGIKHRKELGEFLPSTIISDAWRALLTSPFKPQESLVNLVFTNSNTQEFQLMTLDLQHDTNYVTSQTPMDSGRLESLFRLWGLMVLCWVNFEKSRLRDEVLGNLAEPLTRIMADWRRANGVTSTVKPVFEFFVEYIKSTSVEMKGMLMDCCLIALETAPLPKVNVDADVQHISRGLVALFALMRFRGPLISDRLPSYLLPYRRYLSYIASVATPDCALHSQVALCSNKLERLTKEMVRVKKDVARVAQYLIADILSLMERHPLHHEVKISFSNMIHDLLSLFDKHSTSFVSTALPASTQELFKTVFRDFNKFHRYSGTVLKLLASFPEMYLKDARA